MLSKPCILIFLIVIFKIFSLQINSNTNEKYILKAMWTQQNIHLIWYNYWIFKIFLKYIYIYIKIDVSVYNNVDSYYLLNFAISTFLLVFFKSQKYKIVIADLCCTMILCKISKLFSFSSFSSFLNPGDMLLRNFTRLIRHFNTIPKGYI